MIRDTGLAYLYDSFERFAMEMEIITDMYAPQEPVRREGPKVECNDPCPCGSGKKYKKCCGK